MRETEWDAGAERERFARVWQRVNGGREAPPVERTEGEDAFLRLWLGELARWRGLCWVCVPSLDCPIARAQRRLAARLYLSAGEQIPLRRDCPEGRVDVRTACRALYQGLRRGEAAFQSRGGDLYGPLARCCGAWAARVERRTGELL